MPSPRFTTVDDLSIAYREVGDGDPVLFFHGWPSSSLLWRNILPIVAGANRRAIAIDLPGFGDSDKPVDRTYSLDFYAKVIDGFCDALDLGPDLGIVIHDLGGPVALYWAMHTDRRLSHLAILNTLIFPELSWMARSFLGACKTPGLRSVLVTPWSLRRTLRFGVNSPERVAPEAYDGFCAPFPDRASRKALIKTIADPDLASLHDIAAWVTALDIPVQIVRGAKDRILPRMDHTADRILAALPQAQLETFDDCGHFLQEERPQEIGDVLARFFAPPPL